MLLENKLPHSNSVKLDIAITTKKEVYETKQVVTEALDIENSVHEQGSVGVKHT